MIKCFGSSVNSEMTVIIFLIGKFVWEFSYPHDFQSTFYRLFKYIYISNYFTSLYEVSYSRSIISTTSCLCDVALMS